MAEAWNHANIHYIVTILLILNKIHYLLSSTPHIKLNKFLNSPLLQDIFQQFTLFYEYLIGYVNSSNEWQLNSSKQMI